MKTTIIPSGSQLILGAASKAIASRITAIEARLEALQQDILPDQLKIGLHALKAHYVFAHNPGKGGNKTGKNQHSKAGTVHVDGSSQGFEGWLAANHPKLKKPTAYRWMTALKGLGLNESATDKDVDAALHKLAKQLPAPSLKSLCAAALDAIGPPAEEPKKIEQAEFDFLRQNLSAFRQESENLSMLKDKLAAYPDFQRAATARVYGLLFDLTGTHWAPSDEPDALANVDPDSFTL